MVYKLTKAEKASARVIRELMKTGKQMSQGFPGHEMRILAHRRRANVARATMTDEEYN